VSYEKVVPKDVGNKPPRGLPKLLGGFCFL
jgi:hypothetical protein